VSLSLESLEAITPGLLHRTAARQEG
jgi:hypothetical protein